MPTVDELRRALAHSELEPPAAEHWLQDVEEVPHSHRARAFILVAAAAVVLAAVGLTAVFGRPHYQDRPYGEVAAPTDKAPTSLSRSSLPSGPSGAATYFPVTPGPILGTPVASCTRIKAFPSVSGFGWNFAEYRGPLAAVRSVPELATIARRNHLNWDKDWTTVTAPTCALATFTNDLHIPGQPASPPPRQVWVITLHNLTEYASGPSAGKFPPFEGISATTIVDAHTGAVVDSATY